MVEMEGALDHFFMAAPHRIHPIFRWRLMRFCDSCLESSTQFFARAIVSAPWCDLDWSICACHAPNPARSVGRAGRSGRVSTVA